MVADPSQEMTLSSIVVEKPVTVDFRRLGRTGLKLYGGYVFEEKLPQLQGRRAVDTYREMVDNDSLCGGVLFAYDKMTRQVSWKTERASDHPNDRQAEEFLQECMDDIDQTWTDLISELLSFLQYGFDLHEINYKQRGGKSDKPWLNSRYSDGRVGWKGFSQCAQNSIARWLTNGYGDIIGVEQQAAPSFDVCVIPYEKLLHVRTQSQSNNPEGRSILRSAYRSWYLKRGLENIEAVGAERDLAGYPMILAPSEIMNRGSDEASAMMDRLEEIVTNIKRDEGEGAIMPSDRDERTGQLLYELKLLNSGGPRSSDADKIIQRHDQRIALSMMADFMLLGQGAGSSGSYAMHQDKTGLFTQALTTMLDIVEQTFNRTVIPRLFDLNPRMKINDYPRIVHGRVGTIDLKVMGEYIRNLTAAGAPVFPNLEAETFFADIADIPPPKDPSMTAEVVNPVGQGKSPEVQHLHEGDPDPAPAPGEHALTASSPAIVAAQGGKI